MLRDILLGTVTVGVFNTLTAPFIAQATTDGNPVGMTLGLLTNTGVAGFMLWWLTNRVIAKLDETNKRQEDTNKRIDETNLLFCQMSEQFANIITLSEWATASQKHRQEQIKEAIDKRVSDIETRQRIPNQ